MSDEISVQVAKSAIEQFPSEVKPIKDWKSSYTTIVTENEEAIPKQECKEPHETALQVRDNAVIHPLRQPNCNSSGYQLPYRTKRQLHELFGAKSIPTAETTKARDVEVAPVHPMDQSSGKQNVK